MARVFEAHEGGLPGTAAPVPEFAEEPANGDGRGAGANGSEDGGVGRRRHPPRLLWGFIWASPSSQHSSSFFQTPEMLIFTLGLAALVSLIVFISDLMSERSLRPMSVLIFAAAGTYCFLLIKRQRALAEAERVMMIEIMEASMSTAEPSGLVITKEDRRARFHYFTFRPTAEGDEFGIRDSLEKRPARDDGAADDNGGGSGSGSRNTTGGALPVDAIPYLGSTPPVDSNGNPEVAGGRCTGVSAESRDLEGGLVQGRRGGETAVAVTVTAAAAVFGGGDEAVALAKSDIVAHHSLSGAPPTEGVASPPSQAATASGIRPAIVDETVARSSPKSGCDIGAGEKQGTRRGGSWKRSTGESCIVCFGEYVYGQDLCRLPCSHMYHAECIDEWLDGVNHAWCPLCKKDLLEPEPVECGDGGVGGTDNPADGGAASSGIAEDAGVGISANGAQFGDEAV